jgi:hypothetical protein
MSADFDLLFYHKEAKQCTEVLGWKKARTSFALRLSTIQYICSIACSSVEGII